MFLLVFTLYVNTDLPEQIPLRILTVFFHTCMMTGRKDQITPWHLYTNPVAYLDNPDSPYNYQKFGQTPSTSFVLQGDKASHVHFLSGADTADTCDLVKQVNVKVGWVKNIGAEPKPADNYSWQDYLNGALYWPEVKFSN